MPLFQVFNITKLCYKALFIFVLYNNTILVGLHQSDEVQSEVQTKSGQSSGIKKHSQIRLFNKNCSFLITLSSASYFRTLLTVLDTRQSDRIWLKKDYQIFLVWRFDLTFLVDRMSARSNTTFGTGLLLEACL